jgi:hypothetical protein
MPTPRANETEQDFIARCVIDPEAVADFPDQEQRLAFCYSQYERKETKKLTLKRFDKDKWQRAFERQLDIAERQNIGRLKKIYKYNYFKGIDSFVGSGQTNLQLLFPVEALFDFYRQLYINIGMRFAKWYLNNFDKLLSKSFNPSRYTNQWEASFAAYGSAVAAQRVELVRGTALNTLQAILRGYMADPEFMSLGTQQKATILRRQFAGISQWQAERIVRTESTNAANFATLQSAESAFPGQNKIKEWIASFDDRVRDTHAEAGASMPIKSDEYFMVGGNSMMYPGDPSGGAAEVVNCRCSMAVYPETIEDSNILGGLATIGFMLGGSENQEDQP